MVTGVTEHNRFTLVQDELNDAEFTIMMQHVILPIGYEYNPELIIVSTKFSSNNNLLNGTTQTKFYENYKAHTYHKRWCNFQV